MHTLLSCFLSIDTVVEVVFDAFLNQSLQNVVFH